MKLLAKVGSLALIAAVASGVVAGCSSTDVTKSGIAKGEGATGSVGLLLQPVSGVTLNTIHYVVLKTGSTTPVLEGDLPTPGTAKTFSFGLPLPVGKGYTISLSGVSVESATTTCVGSFGPFDVLANASTNLNMVLTCTDAANGSVNGGVTVTTDSCPRLIVDYVVATPSSATLPGGTIAVAGSAHDLDGKTVTYAWKLATPAVGNFAPANAKTSTLTCAAAGANVGAILTASNGECSKALTTTVSCVSLTCGNGVLDAGEACDASIPAGQPGAGPCLPNCKPVVCGNGVVETPFETCDPVPADPDNCTATCQTRPKVCGDGFLEAGEKCDGTKFATPPPAGTVCNPDCTLPGIVVCGDGQVGGAEICDPGFTKDNCGKDCLSITKASCLACEGAGNCPGVSCDSVVGTAAAGSPAAGVARSNLCNEVLDCVRDSGCAAGGALPIKCYCGTANPTACSAGQGNGACKAQLERGLETTDFNTIASRIGNTVFGGGKAMDRINCDQTFCDTPNASECF